MKRKKKECRKAIDHICENLGENLGSKRCTTIRKHLEGCQDCSSYLKSLEYIVALYKSYPVPPLSGRVRRRLKKALKSARI